ERVELIHHGVNGVLQLQNFSARIYRDLCGKIAAGHGRGHTGDITHLVGEVTGHGVHRIGEILPHAANVLHHSLAAQLPFRTHLARHPRHFRGERAELVHHDVDSVLQLLNLSARVHRDARREIASRHSRGDGGDITY